MLNWEEETNVPLITSCKQAARLVSLSFERKLSGREFLCMKIHLIMCKTCSFYKRQITALRQVFVRHEEVLDNTATDPFEKLAPAVKESIKRAIEDQK